MRKAYISLMSGLPWGGSEVYWSTAASKDLESGHEVFVSVYNWGKDTHPKITELQNKGAIIQLRERFSHDVSFRKKIKRFLGSRIPKLNSDWKELIEFKPDSVFISQGNNLDIATHYFSLYSILSDQNIPFSVISHSHAQFSFLTDKKILENARLVFKNAQVAFFVSQRQWVLTERAIAQKIPNGKFTFNPLNLKDLCQIQYPNTHTYQFAVVGALISGKGHDTLFEVLGNERWQNRDWHLNIYGKGIGLYHLQELQKYFHLEGRITFHGHVNSATEIWEKNNILLIPSSGEGLPISLVESAISGRTAVVTDVGGNIEIIEDNINGFVASAPNPHSYSEALERAWLERGNWQLLGEKLADETLKKIESIQPSKMG